MMNLTILGGGEGNGRGKTIIDMQRGRESKKGRREGNRGEKQ